jgi:hypothetical protein
MPTPGVADVPAPVGGMEPLAVPFVPLPPTFVLPGVEVVVGLT